MGSARERAGGTTRRAGRTSRDDLQRIFESTSEGVVLAGPDGSVRDANPAALEITGYTLRELAGRPLTALVDCGPVGGPEEPVRSRDGIRLCTVTRSDGSRIHAGVRIVGFADGSSVCFIESHHGSGPVEEGLRISEEKYRTLVENTNDVVFSADASGIVTYVSPSLERMTGRRPDEVAGRPFSDFIHPDDLPGLQVSFMRTLASQLESFEFRIFAADGSVMHVRTSSRPHSSAGRIVGITGVMVDITERKRVEEELRHYRDRLEELVLERTRDLAGVNRTLKILTDCNQAIVRALDEKILLQRVCEVIVDAGGYPLAWVGMAEPDGTVSQAARAGRDVGFLDTAGIVWTDTERGRGPTGTAIRTGLPALVRDARTGPRLDPWRDDALRRGFLSSITLPISGDESFIGALTIYADRIDAFNDGEVELLMDLAGDLAFGISSLRERSARSEAEKALAESEERYRGLVEMSPDAIAVHDGGRILFANSSAAGILGVGDPVKAVGMSMAVFIHPDSRPLIAERVRRMLTERQPAPPVEEKFVRLDGTPVEVETVAMPIRWRGNPAVQVTFRDISERKRVEAERERLQTQLAQAQKMELLGSLAGGLAHDFNNMLAVILGHAELMHGSLPETDPLLHELEEIEKAARRSSDLTRRLLAFARKQTIAPRVLDLNATVSAMLGMLRRLIGEGIELDWRPAAGLWAVRLDPVQVDQVLTNLCVNSRDAISGNGRVVIETGNVAVGETPEHEGVPPGDFVLLSVCDDGCGMDDDTQAHLFEPFFTTKGLGQGTGLGLPTVYGVVKQNNGFIRVVTGRGMGTSFHIYLPRESGEVEPPARPDEGPPGPVAGGRETVLLVEDEPGILAICRRILEELGYRVFSSETAGRAMELAKEHPGEIDLLITDVVMPGMNGPELYRRLGCVVPDLRCLYISGYSADFIARQGVLGESVHFVQKPFSMNDLALGIRKALSERGTDRPNR